MPTVNHLQPTCRTTQERRSALSCFHPVLAARGADGFCVALRLLFLSLQMGGFYAAGAVEFAGIDIGRPLQRSVLLDLVQIIHRKFFHFRQFFPMCEESVAIPMVDDTVCAGS